MTQVERLLWQEPLTGEEKWRGDLVDHPGEMLIKAKQNLAN